MYKLDQVATKIMYAYDQYLFYQFAHDRYPHTTVFNTRKFARIQLNQGLFSLQRGRLSKLGDFFGEKM